VQTLDVSAITPERYALVRSFLMRVFQFSPGARVSLAVRLANPVALAMRHTPPPMLDPETFLVCVAAAYQARHGGPGSAAPGAWAQPGTAPAWTDPAWEQQVRTGQH
jgi:DNA-directed RNA polymerase subunit K/omega